MSAALQALLTGAIDYAGLFPPAKLPLDQAIRHYARYRTEPEAWMLGRFVIQAARLGELSPFVNELFTGGPPLAISTLGRGGADANAFQLGLELDLHEIRHFRNRHGQRVKIEVVEVRVPPELIASDIKPLVELIGRAEQMLDGSEAELKIFYEGVLGEHWQLANVALSQAAAAVADQLPQRNPGCKLRCGGLEAAAFPTPQHVAHFISSCASAGVPMKFTAGLHHPLRHFNAGVSAHMHGFLNVFVAGVLACNGWRTDRLVPILEDEDAKHFDLKHSDLHWNHQSLSAEAIAAERAWITSFGSCSFDEPRDDLRAMGLL